MFQQIKTLVIVLAVLTLGVMLARLCLRREHSASLVKVVLPALFFTQTGAFLSPNLFVYHLLTLLVIPIISRGRQDVPLLYLFLLLTLPDVGVPLRVNGLYLTVYHTSASLAVGSLLALLRHGVSKPIQSRGWLIVVVVCLVLIVAQGRDSTASNWARVAVEQALVVILPATVFALSVRTREGLNAALLGLILAGAALAVLALYEVTHFWPIYRGLWSYYGVPLGSGASVKLRAGLLRSPGPFTEPTAFALVLTICLITATTLVEFFKNQTRWLATVGLIVLGLLVPQSRGAWLGAAIGLVVAQLISGKRRRAARAAALAFLGIALFMAGNVIERLRGGVAEFVPSFNFTQDYRASLLDRGIEEFWRAPILGTPLTTVVARLRDLTQGEGLIDFVNTYLYLALTTGGVGLAVAAIALAFAAGVTLQTARRQSEGRADLVAVAASFVSILAMLFLTSLGVTTCALLVLCITLGMKDWRLSPTFSSKA